MICGDEWREADQSQRQRSPNQPNGRALRNVHSQLEAPLPACDLAVAAGNEKGPALSPTGMPGPLVLYIRDLRGSGVVTNAIALARRMGRERETILAASYGKGLNRDVDVFPARLVVLNHAGQPTSRLGEARRLRALLRQSEAAVAVSMGNLGHPAFFLATVGLSVRKIYRISNEVMRPGKPILNIVRRTWTRICLARADRVVLVGGALADLPIFARARARNLAVYIPNGIDLDRAERLLREAGECPRNASEAVIVTIGRIHPQKNLARLIDALSLANSTMPMRLVIVGGGETADVDRLKRFAANLGVGDRVEFVGETHNVFAWLKRADLFALVSLWEGSSTALLEAIAAHVPVVASRQAGDATCVLDGGRYGALVEANDGEDIAKAILQQLGPDRIRPGDRASHYDLRRTHESYSAMFADLS